MKINWSHTVNMISVFRSAITLGDSAFTTQDIKLISGGDMAVKVLEVSEEENSDVGIKSEEELRTKIKMSCNIGIINGSGYLFGFKNLKREDFFDSWWSFSFNY